MRMWWNLERSLSYCTGMSFTSTSGFEDSEMEIALPNCWYR
jgi:hypothetical protein